MFTIKVVIERIKPQNCLTCSNEGETILDTFVVVNGQIAFNKLVESVLKDLGMPHLINESKDNLQTETTLNISSTTTALKSETNELSPINEFSTFSEITNNIMNFPPTNLSMSSGTSNNDDFNEQGSSFNSRQSNNTGKNRFAFDLFSEVPILDQWFRENPHPNCFQIEEYTNILNEQPFRQTNFPLTNLNVKTWFKNRRARSKLKNLSSK
uniref:Homeobox domain-containing protein n=1 Tax=Panagrolaimus davidi TaxID=227884 RepID=A0A914QHD3_9BILA